MNFFTIKNVMKSAYSIIVFMLIMGTAIPTISLADSWELQTVDKEVPGTREIESGDAAKAVRISEKVLERVHPRDEIAVLNNLCIGYIMLEDFEKAERFCDLAVASEQESVVSLNNRGVLRAIEGRFTDASEDFEHAWANGCIENCERAEPTTLDHAHHVALRNLERTQQVAITQQGVAGNISELTVKD